MLVGLVLAGAAPESSAQWFGKKNKTPPQQRVPELLIILKQDMDSHKRADAAEELRQFDSKEFPEIIPALIDALHSDPTASVRIEAATSLGRMRPIAVPVGQALEKAASGDANLRVRLQARTSLTYYQLSGYHAPKKNDPQGQPMSTGEPPLAGAGEQWWKNGTGTAKTPTIPITPGGSSSSNIARPMPSGPSGNPQVPVVTVPSPSPSPSETQGPTIQTNPPPLQTAPTPMWVPAQEQGPSLLPPK
jgi:hypothetical protein